jgi:hypothetical protein
VGLWVLLTALCLLEPDWTPIHSCLPACLQCVPGFNGTGAGNSHPPCSGATPELPLRFGGCDRDSLPLHPLADIDECLVGNGGCSVFTKCVNTVGSWYCGES